MAAFIQGLIVVAIVTVATSYASIKLMPAPLRSKVAGALAGWMESLGVSSINARRVESKLATGGACGSCDSCKACATAGDQVEQAPPTFKHIPIRRSH